MKDLHEIQRSTVSLVTAGGTAFAGCNLNMAEISLIDQV